jgi:hypothetical protein
MASKKTKKKGTKKSHAAAKRKRAPIGTRPKKRVAAARKSPLAKRQVRKVKKKAPGKTKPGAARAKSKPMPVFRREHGGHLDPKYARDLLAQSGGRPDEGMDFLEGSRGRDDHAEGLGEEFVEEVTSGENEGADLQDREVPEERGGPFVVTTGATEFASGTDASNPKGSKREPFPRT